jgi:hypothetical protein
VGDDASTEQQQQQQQLAAAAVVEEEGQDDVMLSEGDINPGWVSPGDARLLVVCNKFETGGVLCLRLWEEERRSVR